MTNTDHNSDNVKRTLKNVCHLHSESSKELFDTILCNTLNDNDIADFSQNSQTSYNNKSVSVNTNSK